MNKSQVAFFTLCFFLSVSIYFLFLYMDVWITCVDYYEHKLSIKEYNLYLLLKNGPEWLIFFIIIIFFFYGIKKGH